jgi:DNA repair protein SbcC/Rad50
MRLHELTVTAFGPFPGTERIDFDDLNDAGLFLLTGPTGAGKTSILDAVCFALYGSVPGARGVKALKSQHADVDAAPEVVLDFSIRDRRFRVRRCPEWVRPKKKGSGLISEKASATLVETTGGEDHFLSSRAQEVGHLIGELMGMTSAQFVQVAMLPQGDFAKFLRASSDERHAVLQHLFRTDRFTRIEDWVNEHSRDLKDQAAVGESTVRRILDTIADRARVAIPEELCAGDLAAAAAEGRALSWAEETRGHAHARLVAATAAHDQTRSAVTEARARHERGQQVAAALSRRAHAEAILERLDADEAGDRAARETLEADTRAGSCLPILRLLDEAGAQRSVARDRHQRSAAALRGLRAPGFDTEDLDAGSAEAVARLAEQLRAQITRFEILLPRERERHEAAAAAQDAGAALARAREGRATRQQRCTALPAQLADLRQGLETATATAARREAILLSLDTARARLDAALEVPRSEQELVRLQDLSRDARDRAAAAREHVQDLADRRLAGIAAELAGLLADGQACQVCGSLDHPQPARAGSDAVTESEQERASIEYDARTEEYAEAARRVADAERRLEALRQASQGLDVAAAQSQVSDLEEALDGAERSAADRDRLHVEIDALAAEQADLAAALSADDSEIARLEHTLAAHRATVARVTDEIVEATGGAELSLEHGLSALQGMLEVLSFVIEAANAVDAAALRLEELTSQATQTASGCGFEGLEEVRSAALPGPERQRLETLLAERAEAGARARAVLEDPQVLAAAGQPVPDLEQLAAVLRDAETAHEEATREHHQCDELVGSLTQNLARLRVALEEWAPLRDRYVRAEAMSKLVRGMGHDNQLQMRLSAYVLATRLDQVVAAANERLAHMRDQRYLLQRTGRAARKGAQAGLGLEVVDQWTGDVRDPATLSGGETFVVSLSLALGLADVVTQEAGGTEIDTLFVDEGFGTLDPDTLDDVMDRLDGLRAGGRTVGVVSHVTELRNRIPTQVHVAKHRTGSSVAVRTLTE